MSVDKLLCQIQQVQQIHSQFTSQAKIVDGLQNGLTGMIKANLTPGIYEGQGADNFGGYMTTKFFPHLAALMAAIAGFGGGIGSALDLVMNADKQGASEMQGFVDGAFNF